MQGRAKCEEVRVLAVLSGRRHARRVGQALGQAGETIAAGQRTFRITVPPGLSQALDLLRRRAFDVVLLELGAPHADGLEALDRVVAAGPGVAVVMLGAADEDTALAAIERGAQEYLSGEPWEGHRLRRAVRLALQRKRAQRRQLRHARQLETACAEIKQQAAELEARAVQLDPVNRELSDFAYIASHDLKEPLLGMRAHCDLLLADCHQRLDPDGRRRLAALGTMCDRLGELIDNLLAYCRAGRIASPPAEVDLNAVAREVLQTLQPGFQQRDVSVRVASRLPVVRGDATLIGTVLANLVTNGLKFNDSPRPEVEIGSLPGRPPVIYVRDNGIGIARQHHEAVFEIFRRLHSRKKYEGAGAGLTIVRKMVRAHGGRIWLDSEPGRGSTFYFTLAPDDQRAGPQAPHWMTCTTTYPCRRPQIRRPGRGPRARGRTARPSAGRRESEARPSKAAGRRPSGRRRGKR